VVMNCHRSHRETGALASFVAHVHLSKAKPSSILR
jgi:hypothetical protein